jgi:preprotein translocase subunit SecF
MTAVSPDGTHHSIWTRLFRGETAFDFVGRRKRWFTVSAAIIVIGLAALLLRGLNFGIDFKGGTVWEVKSNASVAHVRDVVGAVSPELRQATIEILTDRTSGAKTVRVSAEAKATKDKTKVAAVTDALAKMAGVDINQITLNDVGPTWGHDITQKAERALIIFLVAVVIYITFRFEGKMAIAALLALIHDILITVGVYAISGFQVSPATVIAFLTILGYSLYDTIVVFDKIEENTKGLASTGRITYTETVNLSMNQVLMRSINTSLVAIMPILSILVIGSFFLGAASLQDFGLALFIGLLTGAYSSIFIASPILAVMKEREPRYSQIRQRLASRASMTGVLTPAAAAAGAGDLLTPGGGGGGGSKSRAPKSSKAAPASGRKAAGAGKAAPGTAKAGAGKAAPGGKATPGAAASAAPAGRPVKAPRPTKTPRTSGSEAGANPATPATVATAPVDDEAGAEGLDVVEAAEVDPAATAGTATGTGSGTKPASGGAKPRPANRGGSRPTPRPRKKGRRR